MDASIDVDYDCDMVLMDFVEPTKMGANSSSASRFCKATCPLIH